MDPDQFLLSLARRAYAEKPFYRWFYDNANVDVELARVHDIPFLTKQDLFRYEQETGNCYYLPVIYPKEQLNLRFTSGTTGRPLEIPWLKTEYFITWSTILFNFLQYVKGRPRILAPVKPAEAEMMKATGSTFVCVPDNRMTEIPYVLDLIAKYRPNVVMDSSPGLWFQFLVERGLEPHKMGIQLLLAYPNEELARRVGSWGMSYGSFFACEEAGMMGYGHGGMGEEYHLVNDEPEEPGNSVGGRRNGLLTRLQLATNLFTCDCYAGVDLTSLVGKRDIRVQREGEMASTGTGKLVITCANSIFPLIKYLNGDFVELVAANRCECGFSGRSLNFKRREHEVRIPYGLGDGLCLFNLARIAQELKGFDRVFPVYYPLARGVRIIVTFVEAQGIETQRVDDDLSEQIVLLGSGMSMEHAYGPLLKSYLPFLPVVYLPPGTIPFRDRDSVKSRLYLDAVAGHVPPEYLPLLGLVPELVDLERILEVGNSFWMYFAKDLQSAERE